MNMKNPIDLIALILVVVGAVNWGLYGALNKMDLVAMIFGSIPIAAQIVYILVGIAGLYMLYAAFMKK